TGGLDMTLLEVDEAANAISSEVDQDANIIFGAAFDPSLEGRIRVSVVATGMDSAHQVAMQPASKPAAQPAPRPIMQTPPRGTTIRPGIADQPSEPLWGEAAQFAAASAPMQQPMAEAAFEVAVANAAHTEDTIRIVDPAVEAFEDDLPLDYGHEEDRGAPAIQPPRTYASAPAVEHRRAPPANPLPDPRVSPEPRKGGFLSLFGSRPRYDAPPAQPAQPARQTRAPYVGGGQAAAAQQQVEPAPQNPEAGEDLEIPSFLRRLAN
ncbi:MAG: cell division protein FtsZ, partial [Caulobacteraceae bacterium]